MSYFINEIKDNTYNHYKYHYLDHLTTVIDIRDNYWSFAIDLYSINDFKLPINSLAGDLQLPYQRMENIAFNLASDQTGAQEAVKYNKKYCHIYSGCFNVDISQNDFFKQDLNNTKIDLTLSLFIDPEAAKAAGTDISQDNLDNLINETNEQRWDFVAYYTNTHLIDNSCEIDNITGFNLPIGKQCIPTINPILVSLPSLENLKVSFNDLITISSIVPFQIMSGKIKFYYWLELSSECKTIETVLEIDRQLSNSKTVSLNNYTVFDYGKNEVVFDPIGVKGFNIPKYSQGYYELELQVQQDNTINKFIIKNKFSFQQNIIKPYIAITHRVIESLEGFKEVNF
ncbi:MAG: hypothetical protein KBS35_02965 [Mycoplasma sp.]|nr:hypothetical protein [Candidatus Hennigella equi]